MSGGNSTSGQQPQQRAWRRFRRSPSARLGGLLAVLFAVLALSADAICAYDPDQRHRVGSADAQRTFARFEPPSTRFWLGTDENAKDVWTRVIYGSRLSLLAGVTSILLAMLIGVPAGVIAGYFGRWTDALIMRGIDVALAFPSVLIALLVAMALRPGWTAVIAAVGLINVPVFARQVRASVLTIRHLDYVTASQALGASNRSILLRNVLPGVISPIIVLATLGLGTAILEVAGLSFLGIGGDPTEPEWGSMLNQAKNQLRYSVWPAVGPGVAISLSILGFNLLGDGLRDALDPQLGNHPD